MALVNYDETDTEDDDRVWSSSTNRGGNMFLGGSTIGQPPLLERPFCSGAPPRQIQVKDAIASHVSSRGLDQSGGMSDPIFHDSEGTWKRTPGEINANVVTVGGVKRKVISMELAMQKEVAYKKKMEGLKTRSRNELQESPVAVQGVISSARTAGIKRPAQVTNSCEQPPQSQPVIHICEECNVICSGALNLEMHRRGKKHKTKLEELENQNGGKGIVPLECSLCKIPCMNERCLQQHMAGKKHAACLQAVTSASEGRIT